MISLKEYNSKTRLPKADYVFEDVKTLSAVLPNLTPKIEGLWDMLLINPTIKECKQLLDSTVIPQWITLTVFLQNSKLENICLQYPQYQPKKVSFKEQAQTILSGITHTVDPKAFNVLLSAFRGNIVDLQATLELLDKECSTAVITLNEVQKRVNYQKPTYASEVMNAFLLKASNRWKLLNNLVQQLGEEFAYNALYKYVKSLLLDKEDYLHNKSVKNQIISRIDAPAICNAYVAFTLSSNYKQLRNVLQVIECRSLTNLNVMSEYYLD